MSTLNLEAAALRPRGAARLGSRGAMLLLLGALLAAAALAAVGTGAVSVPPPQAVSILLDKLGLPAPWAFDARQAAVLWSIRLPRVLLGIIVGAGLGTSGAAMQGLFRNPLADPALIGVSGGAAVGAVGWILLGGTVGLAAGGAGVWMMSAAAFAGGLGAMLFVYRLSVVDGRVSVATMLLAGIAVNALAGALIGLASFAATDAQLRSITFWNLGSLGGATWPAVGVAAAGAAGAAMLLRLPGELNAMLLGESDAAHLGVNVTAVKRKVILLTALAVAAGVAFTGVIGFVGLVVPHLLRMAVGPDHRTLLPGSALLGAAVLVSADLLARTAAAPAELPIGVLTALLGTPVFIALLVRGRSEAA